MAFHTLNSLNVPTQKIEWSKVRKTRRSCNGPTQAAINIRKCAMIWCTPPRISLSIETLCSSGITIGCAINQVHISELYWTVLFNCPYSMNNNKHLPKLCAVWSRVYDMQSYLFLLSDAIKGGVWCTVTIVYVRRWQWCNYLFPTYGYITTNLCFGLLYHP